MKYDLEERVSVFGEQIIKFVRSLKYSDVILQPLVKQLVRSATSVGANYMEANQASSLKDFTNKVNIAKKEANETKYWLRMVATANPDKAPECRVLWKEAHELLLILNMIIKKSRKRLNNENQ